LIPRIRTILLAVLVLLTTLPVRAEVAAEMAGALRDQGLTGATWALVTPDGVTTGAAGLADADTGAAMRPDHRVQVGSVTKTVLAAGVLRLVTLGRLSLNQPVADILPAVAIDNPWAATHILRLRHLLDHTSGLDDARLWQVFSMRPAADSPLAQGVVHEGQALRLRWPPGERFSYSNTGYTLLGMVMEAVTGERYETWLDREFLAPLGMRDSTFGFVTQMGPGADARLAMGHFDDGSTQAAIPWFTRPAGQFTTTAADIARFAQFLMGDGTIDATGFIAADLLRAMGRPTGTAAAMAGLPIGYALGLQTRDRHGVVGLCHSGNIVGYRAMLCLYPDQGKAFFISVNADSETASYPALDAVMVRALRLSSVAPLPSVADPGMATWQGLYTPMPNRFDQFAYLDGLTATIQVTAVPDGLRLTNMQRPDRLLLPLGDGLVRQQDRTIASHVFMSEASGVSFSDGGQSYQRIPAWRFWLGWVSVGFGLLGLGWLLLSGLWRLLTGPRSLGGMIPLAALLSLVLPVPLLLWGQSFLQLGDPTPGNVLLAVVTGLLPLALLTVLFLDRRRVGWGAWIDRAATIAALQWLVVLAFGGLIPLRLWS
jgi:CubicO group peptidase (beta-lactamase class C family)